MPKGKGKGKEKATPLRRSSRVQKIQREQAWQQRHSLNPEIQRNTQRNQAVALSMLIRKLNAYEPGIVDYIRTIAQDKNLAQAIDATSELQEVEPYLGPNFSGNRPEVQLATDALARAAALSKTPLLDEQTFFSRPYIPITPAEYKTLWVNKKQASSTNWIQPLGRIHYLTGPRKILGQVHNPHPNYIDNDVNPNEVMSASNALLWKLQKTIQMLRPEGSVVPPLPLDPVIVQQEPTEGGSRTRRSRTRRSRTRRCARTKK